MNELANATCSSQYTIADFHVLVSNATASTIPVHRAMIHQYGVTKPTHNNEHIAAIIAETECTLNSIAVSLNVGAVPTNAIEAGAKNDKN